MSNSKKNGGHDKPKNPKNVAKGRKGGRIGGKSRSAKKRAASKRNILKAIIGKRKASRVDEVNELMLENRVRRFAHGASTHTKGVLDDEFTVLLNRKERLLGHKKA